MEESERPPHPVTETGSFLRRGDSNHRPGQGHCQPPSSSVHGEEPGAEGQRGPGKHSLLSGWSHFLLDGAGWENTHLSKCRRPSHIYTWPYCTVYVHVHIRPRKTYTKTLTVLCLYDKTVGALIFLKKSLTYVFYFSFSGHRNDLCDKHLNRERKA